MNRLYILLSLALALSAAGWSRAAQAGVLDPQVMKVVLHTSAAQDEGFIDYVVYRVDRGTLPLDLVQSTFLWARKKHTKKFFYFKQGLILRAAAQGITL
jgi:hypothetical protein